MKTKVFVGTAKKDRSYARVAPEILGRDLPKAVPTAKDRAAWAKRLGIKLTGRWPNWRQLVEHEMLHAAVQKLPRRRTITIVLDTSENISDGELKKFMAEAKKLKGGVRKIRVARRVRRTRDAAL